MSGRVEVIGDATLYLDDCLEILPTLEAGSVDAVVTDPPYGVNFICGSPDGRIQSSAIVRHREPIIGDDKPFDPAPFLNYPVVILFGANNYASRLPDSRGWVFWNKRPNMKKNDFGDGEFIWTNQDLPIRYFEYLWNGVLQAGEKGLSKYHSAQKPISLMVWLLKEYAHSANIILDPFMGSGTTGVAALRLGRKFIGIEIKEEYFDIACKRIEQENRQLKMF